MSYRGLPVFLLFALLVPTRLASRDLPEPPESFDAFSGLTAESPALLPSSFLMLRYDSFVFRGSQTDTFRIGALGSFGLARLGENVALKLSYGTHLLVGPLAEGDVPASSAEWWMNSVQFQYGIYSAANIHGYHILAEYSRMSNHPLRPELTPKEKFENPASERFAGGIVFPETGLGSITGNFYVRSGFVDLFDYWQAANIPKPRTWWFYRFGGEVSYPLGRSAALFARPVVDILALRSGKFDTTRNLETGVAFPSGGRRLRLYLVYEESGDTEEIMDQKNPVRLWGLGFSLSS